MFQAYLKITMSKTVSSAYNILPWNLRILLLSFLANMSGGFPDDFNRLENSILMQAVSCETAENVKPDENSRASLAASSMSSK